MRTFNWEKFKQGKIKVECRKSEFARNFLWECQEQGYVWHNGKKIELYDTGWDSLRMNIHYIVNKYGKLEVADDEIDLKFEIIEWERYKFETVKEKYNLMEVMANKKPYQTWIGGNYIVNVDEKNDIKISCKDSSKTEPIQSLNIDLTSKVYVLQEIKISFDEAVAICEKDDKKTMRSVVTKDSYMIEYRRFRKYNRYKKNWENISVSLEEMKGKWVIEPISWIDTTN